MKTIGRTWRVVIWTLNSAQDREDWIKSLYVDTQDQANSLRKKYTDSYDCEIYGPNGFYEGVK